MIHPATSIAGWVVLWSVAALPNARAQQPPTRPGHTMSMPMAPGDSGMAMADPLGVSMDRMGSGTTWIPEATPIASLERMAGAWHLMAHGALFVQQDWQSGPRGDQQFGSLNWGMFMASRSLGGGRLQLRTMLSLDAAGVGKRGYPLLFQTGESVDGQPLHDRQHPHDAIMELAASYERPVSKSLGVSFYAAPSGEPALGPVAVMHRPSSIDIPTAPISHHWQDATHVTFGVLTAGVFSHSWKLEASAFNGREPDDERWNIERPRLDSYATRVTVNPNAHWSLTAGYGFLHAPEPATPNESLHRFVTSALYGQKFRMNGQWSASAVCGINRTSDGDVTHGALFESELAFDRTHTVLARVEWVQKPAEALVLDDIPPARVFDIGALSLGYVHNLARWRRASVGLGVMGTLNVAPTALSGDYGSRTPRGGLIFLRVRPTSVP